MDFTLPILVTVTVIICASVFYIAFYISNLRYRVAELLKINSDLLQELTELKNTPPKKTLTVDAQQLLHDLTTHGNAAVRIVPISVEDIFLRSPK